MEDQEIEESTDADGTSVASPSEHGLHSEDSRNSEDSYLYNNDDPLDENDYDDWGSDAYYNGSTEDDSKYESCSLIVLDSTQDQSVEILDHVPPVVEITDEALEENNNDPNNNMDSIELNGLEEAAGPLHDFAPERPKETNSPEVLYVDRPQSPKPGCSKDSQPVFAPSMPSNTSPNEGTMIQKMRHILSLVSKIHRDSVFDALCKDDKVPIKELKLWDLIPERERREYPEINSRQDKSREEKASDHVENTVMQMEWTVTNNGAKRGPADDICTVQPKKSSSDPDLSISALADSNSLPKVSSTSEIAHLPQNRGAIPKVRDVPREKRPETPIQAWNALLSEAQNAAPKEELPLLRPAILTRENPKIDPKSRINEPFVEKSDVKSVPSSCVVRAPILKYPATKSAASKPNITELEKSKPSARSAMPKPVCTSTPISAGPSNQQRPKEMENRLAKSAPTTVAPINAAAAIPVMHTQHDRRKQIQMELKEKCRQAPAENRAKQSAPVTTAPINQQRQAETVNRTKQPVPVTAAPINKQRQAETVNRSKQPVPVTAATTLQQRQTETVNRPKPPAPVATVAINQQRHMEMVNRLEQVTKLAAAPNNQQRQMDMANLFPHPAPITAATTYDWGQMESVNLLQPFVTVQMVKADYERRQREMANRLPHVLGAPSLQWRQTEMANRLQQATPVTAATTHQQRQTEMANRLQQATPVTAATTHQQRQTETGNQPKQRTTTTAPVTAAPINQQRRPETVNRPTQPAPTRAPVAAAPLYEQCPMDLQEQQLPAILPEEPKLPHQPAAEKEQSTKRVFCKEMYYKLRNIFPNVDRKYLKKLCPPDWGAGNKDDQMAPIIEHLLEAGETLPQQPIKEIIERAENNVSYKSADDLYEFFIGIFPDADPHYLRDFAVSNLGKDDAIKNFVDTNLERREYPTREQYMARLKITEQQRRYTTGFEVKQFLSIIPDPSKHFLDAQRKCSHQTVAFEFLKSHFKKLRVATISRAYSQNRYNLSLAAQTLESMPDELKSKRGGSEMPTEDILLLQEIAFVKHKADINKYIAQVKKTEDEEFKTLKAMNQLLECQCCYDSECVPSKCSECDNGHVFCNSCVVTGTNAKMGEDQTRIHCFINCGSEFSLSVLQRVLVPTTFSILLKKRQAAEVIEAGLEGLVSCPFCHFASIPPEGDKIFKCLNPECTKESCRLCKELSHVPLKCDEVTKTENARRYIEEKMTEALARKCYRCKRAFFKEEGCNKITCPCGAIMCYLCDAPIKDYSHFRGQGSNDRTLCPLYSDTIRLDAVAVRKVAEEAQREMLKRNPNINIDTTGLLPDIPRPTNGPHNDVLNADELPRRAQRVLDLPPL